ncbi:hypothetical protein CPAR01_03172 [Colletotrichum paranaense]|uniref:Uncharacterized protein n=1 Tax=Colletotrichum paranaense TaxID=1914294 RepID=A0ABQ9T1L8_9PEZI|nr:uncharacterized protein CPAR01_03172 [Colletotrichum paranaense]KAK1545670.1 hypothetical protein CPAR01_03172 [Colletotrichum paranaense]
MVRAVRLEHRTLLSGSDSSWAFPGPVAGLPASPQDVDSRHRPQGTLCKCSLSLSFASRLSPTKRRLSSQGPVIDVYPPSSGPRFASSHCSHSQEDVDGADGGGGGAAAAAATRGFVPSCAVLRCA